MPWVSIQSRVICIVWLWNCVVCTLATMQIRCVRSHFYFYHVVGDNPSPWNVSHLPQWLIWKSWRNLLGLDHFYSEWWHQLFVVVVVVVVVVVHYHITITITFIATSRWNGNAFTSGINLNLSNVIMMILITVMILFLNFIMSQIHHVMPCNPIRFFLWYILIRRHITYSNIRMDIWFDNHGRCRTGTGGTTVSTTRIY